MKSQQGGIEFLVLAVVVLASFIIAGGTFSFNNSLPQNSGQAVNIQDTQSGAGQNTLQIQGLKTATPAPAPPVVYQPPPAPPTSGNPTATQPPATSTCGLTTTPWGDFNVNQNNCGTNNCVIDGPATKASDCCPGSGGQANWPDSRVPYWCDAKPVIYLYPTKPTNVSVKVTIPGKITVSIPKYKEIDGWKDVLAYPDGTLIYKGNKYSELFYETAQERTAPPVSGWVVKRTDLKSKLSEITARLGLNNKEQAEFLSYWLPRLNSLDKPYVFVSFFDPLVKDSVDKVDITPKPDNFIQFIMYFKGLDKNQKVDSPTYPLIPKRTGFTAVEWGGILDY
jgi:hypothetical protein